MRVAVSFPISPRQDHSFSDALDQAFMDRCSVDFRQPTSNPTLEHPFIKDLIANIKKAGSDPSARGSAIQKLEHLCAFLKPQVQMASGEALVELQLKVLTLFQGIQEASTPTAEEASEGLEKTSIDELIHPYHIPLFKKVEHPRDRIDFEGVRALTQEHPLSPEDAAKVKLCLSANSASLGQNKKPKIQVGRTHVIFTNRHMIPITKALQEDAEVPPDILIGSEYGRGKTKRARGAQGIEIGADAGSPSTVKELLVTKAGIIPTWEHLYLFFIEHHTQYKLHNSLGGSEYFVSPLEMFCYRGKRRAYMAIYEDPLTPLPMGPQSNLPTIRLWDSTVLLKQILTGIRHAHKEGVTLGDLKWAHILRGPDGKIKIIDIGIGVQEGALCYGWVFGGTLPPPTAIPFIQSDHAGAPLYPHDEKLKSPEGKTLLEVAPYNDIWAWAIMVIQIMQAEDFAGFSRLDVEAQTKAKTLLTQIREYRVRDKHYLMLEKIPSFQADLLELIKSTLLQSEDFLPSKLGELLTLCLSGDANTTIEDVCDHAFWTCTPVQKFEDEEVASDNDDGDHDAAISNPKHTQATSAHNGSE